MKDVRVTPWAKAPHLTRETTHSRLMTRADRWGYEERFQFLQRDGSITSTAWRRAPGLFPRNSVKVQSEDAA